MIDCKDCKSLEEIVQRTQSAKKEIVRKLLNENSVTIPLGVFDDLMALAADGKKARLKAAYEKLSPLEKQTLKERVLAGEDKQMLADEYGVGVASVRTLHCVSNRGKKGDVP